MSDQLEHLLQQLNDFEQHDVLVALQKSFIALAEHPELLQEHPTRPDEVRVVRERLLESAGVRAVFEEGGSRPIYEEVFTEAVREAEHVFRARAAVNAVWQQGLSIIAQHYLDAREQSGSALRAVLTRSYSDLLWTLLAEAAVQEEASFYFIRKFLQDAASHFKRAINALFIFKRRDRLPIFGRVTLIIALVRFKSVLRDGCGILLRRPPGIPLTVQPCAP